MVKIWFFTCSLSSLFFFGCFSSAAAFVSRVRLVSLSLRCSNRILQQLHEQEQLLVILLCLCDFVFRTADNFCFREKCIKKKISHSKCSHFLAESLIFSPFLNWLVSTRSAGSSSYWPELSLCFLKSSCTSL